MVDAPAQAPSPAAAALLVRFDLEHPPPVERSTARIPGSGDRSQDLVNVVEVEGGLFLPIAGLGVPRRSRKPLVLAVIGVVLTLAINVAVYAIDLGGISWHAAISAGVFSLFGGMIYRARADAGKLAAGRGRTPGVLVLDDEMVIHYPDRDVAYSRSQVTDLRYRKLESKASDGAHIIIEYSLFVVLTSSEMESIWKLVQYSGQFDGDVDAASALMPLIVHRLQTAWGFMPTAEKTWD